ncbi:hypothetical protein [Nioella aestuarii]|uniref:hypothetical protein n=1 Tax=Nioella aestuarii TaxID=1662864 RepID=UPI003D7FA10D
MTESTEIESAPPSWRESLPRLAVKLVVLVAIVVLSHVIIDYSLTWAESLPAQAEARMERLILLAVFVTYALLIALPFVPGIEIAIALLVLRGPEFALPIYFATLGGLSLAFLAGRLVPIRSLKRFFLDLHLAKAAALVDRLGPMSPAQRVRELQRSLPRKHARFALRYRYVGLALLINLPGSGLIGGGGGICLMAGMSGVFTPRVTLPTIAIAILPFPLFMWFAGSSGLMPWLPA